jgi:membrane-bound lytic murein transglycosylase D
VCDESVKTNGSAERAQAGSRLSLGGLCAVAVALVCLASPAAWAESASAAPTDGLNDTQALLEANRELLGRLRSLERRLEQATNHRLPLAAYKLPETITLCGDYVPQEMWDVKMRLEREFLSILSSEPVVLLWIKRANRYFPDIEKRIRLAELPDDVKYTTVVESNLNPQARSWAGAVGMWQFIRSTGRKYGLNHSYWMDERRDYEKATDGALSYLKDLYEEFQSWPLALAAYNAGGERVREAMVTQGVTNYYQLALPRETERYVFRIIAAKVILEDPAKYGFALDEPELYKPLDTEWVKTKVIGRRLHLREVAEAAGTYFRHIKQLNPRLRRDSLPRGVHRIRIPAGAAKDFNARLKAIRQRNTRQAKASREGQKSVTYRVKKGDSLWAIAERYGVSVKALRRWNGIRRGEPIYAGERLLIYVK